MSNLARPLTPPVDPAGDLLDELRAARAGAAPLPGLDPATYARSHEGFERLSDQRQLIAADLAARLLRHEGDVSVLSVGCGDGTLDAALATALVDADPGRRVRWTGVEPYAGSAAAFAERLGRLTGRGLDLEVHATTFDEAPVAGPFDVITFVHSMYYVPDVAAAVRRAHDLLRPGGELLVLSAPRAELNALVEVLAPPVEGHEQWFSDDVAAGVRATGLRADTPTTLGARWDAAAADDEVLDFAVQARLTDDLRPTVRSYLSVVSAASPGDRVPHPVDVHRVVRRPCSG
ncbi:methyltransferase domain-containing protein [Nocardioides litoris]|uniref:methyltransferase domain-containing protein n=1 Tax=Nocardioides litoris TaxID=1926648 RepID=UPI00147704C4|nr:methyltransferase domain-containing protein [Nocardioides litoris]